MTPSVVAGERPPFSLRCSQAVRQIGKEHGWSRRRDAPQQQVQLQSIPTSWLAGAAEFVWAAIKRA